MGTLDFALQDLVDVDVLDKLLSNLYDAAAIPSAIIDLNGTILTGAGWQRICTGFHRQNEDSCKLCIESDTQIRETILAGSTFEIHTCPHGLIDASSPVIVEGKHLANVFVGQLLTEPITPEIEASFRKRAKLYGFDEEEYIRALREVPILQYEKFESILKFLAGFTKMIIEMGVTSLRQKRQTMQLEEGRERFELALLGADLGTWDWNVATGDVIYNDRWAEMLGYTLDEMEPNVSSWESLVHPDDMSDVTVALHAHFEGKTEYYASEHRVQHKSGKWVWVLDKGKVINRDSDGKPRRVCGTHLDITERKELEHTLRENNQIFDHFMENSPIYLFFKDENIRSLRLSKNYEAMLGRPLDDLLGKNMEELFPSDLARSMVDDDKRILNDGIEFSVEETLNGRHYSTVKFPIKIDGIPKFLAGYTIDVTERKQAEQQLIEKELFLENINDIAYTADREGIVTYVNSAAETIIGLKINEIVGKPFLPLFVEEDHESLMEVYTRTLAGEKLVNTLTFVNGATCHFSSLPLTDSKGEIVGTFGIARDITEMIKAQEKLADTERRYLALVHQSPIAYEVYDEGGTQLMVNAAYEAMYGLKAEDSVGKFNVKTDPQVDNLGLRPFVDKAYSGEPVKLPEFEWDPKLSGFPGRARWLSTRIYPLKDDQNVVTNIVITHEDVTERRIAETALRQIEERHHIILKTAMDGFWVTDGQGNLKEVNERYCKMSGYSEEELLSMRISDLEAEESSSDVIEHLQNVLTFGEDRFESRHRRKDGSIYHVEISVQYKPDDGGRYVAFIQEITERHEMQRALAEERNLLDLITQNSPTGICVVDASGIISFANPVAENILGLSRNELKATTFDAPDWKHTTFDGKPFKDEDQPFVQVMRSGQPVIGVEQAIHRPNGERTLLSINAAPLKAEDGTITGVVAVLNEVTEQKLAEQALLESQKRLLKAQSVARIGNWEYDIETRKIWGSEKAFEIYGLERKTEFLPLEEVQKLNNDPESGNQALVDLITKNTPYDIEFEINTNYSDKPVVIHSFAELELDANGKPVKVLGVIQDITDMKAKEIENSELTIQLQQAQRMESVGRLAGGVAHDFNNMLGVILGHTEFAMEMLTPGDPMMSDLVEIRSAAKRSANLTQQLLAFARKQTITPKLLDLNEVLSSMLTMLRRLIGEDIALGWKPEKDLWTVKMDPTQVDQILANLCVNARDAISGIGNITIHTRNVSLDASFVEQHSGFSPGDYVLLAVSDDGAGMDEDTLEKLFEPFYTTKPTGEGTGLGLATVYGAIKQNGGYIDVISEPGKGATFNIYLPRFIGSSRSGRQNSLTDPLPRGDETILLVEDEEAMLGLTKKVLEKLGYTVLAANSPKAAIKLMQEHSENIDLLITDVIMPEMNGRDLADYIAGHYPGIKQLFMSGYTADVIAQRGVLEEGMNLIEKPFSSTVLATRVRDILD